MPKYVSSAHPPVQRRSNVPKHGHLIRTLRYYAENISGIIGAGLLATTNTFVENIHGPTS